MKAISFGLLTVVALAVVSFDSKAAVVAYYWMPGSSCVYDADPQTNCNFRVGAAFFTTGTNVVNVTLKNSCFPRSSNYQEYLRITTQGLGNIDTNFYMWLETTVPWTQDYWYNNDGTFTVRTQFKPWGATEVQRYLPTTARVALMYQTFTYQDGFGLPPKVFQMESVPKSCVVSVELVKYGKGPGR